MHQVFAGSRSWTSLRPLGSLITQMCGRAYETYTEEELELRYLSERRKHSPLKGFQATYNLAPTQLSPVVLIRDHQVEIEMFRWGLIPFWAKDPKDASRYSLINAKAEEVDQKRSYQAAFRQRRCIMPVSGFFEWHRTEEGPKRPYVVRLKDHGIMSLAGIWECWEPRDSGKGNLASSARMANRCIYSFAIITCQANSLMEGIHNRMPVILDSENEQQWLSPENHDPVALKSLLKPCSSELLEAYEIGTLVNSPKNNSKEVIQPLG